MKKYNEYKESGLNHIGEIPVDWNVVKLKFIGQSLTGITYSPENVVEEESEGKLVLRSSNIQNGKLALTDKVYVNKKFNDKYLTKQGDILICSRNGSRNLIGKNILIDQNLENETWGAFMTVFRTDNSRFVYYFFNSAIFKALSSLFLSSTINQLTIGVINNFTIALPSLPEQTQIANYLDHQTNLIDAIIEKKELLIKRLKEQRQAIINEAVTKGLNPNAKMKDSGIEWLGEIPEHWEVTKLGRLGNFMKGKGITKNEIKDSGYPCIRNGELYTSYEMEFQEAKSFISEDYLNQTLTFQKGILMYAGDGETNEDIGKCVLYFGEKPINVGGGINVFIPNEKKVDPQFLALAQNSSYSTFQKAGDGRGGIIVHIYSKQLKDHYVVLPKLNEQKIIYNEVIKKLKNIDVAIKKIRAQFYKLKTYRQSIISEAVTGKIDVREWEPKTAIKV